MLKLILCCGLCISSTLVSLELYRQRLLKAEIAKDLADKIAEITALLRFESADVYELCQTVFSGRQPCDYSAFVKITSGNFPALWENACKSLPTDARSAALFLRAGKILGSCDSESQIKLLAALHNELREHSKAIYDRAEGLKKLYTTLGALLGAAVSIMMI